MTEQDHPVLPVTLRVTPAQDITVNLKIRKVPDSERNEIMGLTRTKDSVVTDAERAIQEGRHIFVCRLHSEASHGANSMHAVAETIEGIESHGWRLDHMAYCPADRTGVVGVYLFRRTR